MTVIPYTWTSAKRVDSPGGNDHISCGSGKEIASIILPPKCTRNTNVSITVVGAISYYMATHGPDSCPLRFRVAGQTRANNGSPRVLASINLRQRLRSAGMGLNWKDPHKETIAERCGFCSHFLVFWILSISPSRFCSASHVPHVPHNQTRLPMHSRQNYRAWRADG